MTGAAHLAISFEHRVQANKLQAYMQRKLKLTCIDYVNQTENKKQRNETEVRQMWANENVKWIRRESRNI